MQELRARHAQSPTAQLACIRPQSSRAAIGRIHALSGSMSRPIQPPPLDDSPDESLTHLIEAKQQPSSVRAPAEARPWSSPLAGMPSLPPEITARQELTLNQVRRAHWRVHGTNLPLVISPRRPREPRQDPRREIARRSTSARGRRSDRPRTPPSPRGGPHSCAASPRIEPGEVECGTTHEAGPSSPPHPAGNTSGAATEKLREAGAKVIALASWRLQARRSSEAWKARRAIAMAKTPLPLLRAMRQQSHAMVLATPSLASRARGLNRGLTGGLDGGLRIGGNLRDKIPEWWQPPTPLLSAVQTAADTFDARQLKRGRAADKMRLALLTPRDRMALTPRNPRPSAAEIIAIAEWTSPRAEAARNSWSRPTGPCLRPGAGI